MNYTPKKEEQALRMHKFKMYFYEPYRMLFRKEIIFIVVKKTIKTTKNPNFFANKERLSLNSNLRKEVVHSLKIKAIILAELDLTEINGWGKILVCKKGKVIRGNVPHRKAIRHWELHE